MMKHEQEQDSKDLHEINHQLRSFEESLFNIEEKHLHKVKAFMVESDLSDEQAETVESFTVTARLMFGNVDSLAEMIERAIETEPEGIHAWCNKGVYHVMRGEREAAAAALARVQELRNITAPLIVSQRDHAYWIAEFGREKDHYSKAFIVFESIIYNKSYLQDESLKLLLDKTAELYLRVLVRLCRNFSLCKDKNDSFFAKQLHLIVDLVIIIWNSNIDEREALFFTWLAEVYKNYRFNKTIEEEMKRLSNVIGCSTELLTHMSCLEKAEENAVRTNKPKFLARAAKNWYYFAAESKEKGEMACQKAIQLCELSLATGADVFMASDILCKSHMHLWALEYDRQCRSAVYSEYEEVMGVTSRISPWQIWRFLTRGLFFVNVTNAAGKDNLEKAHEIMQKLQEKHAKGLHKTAEFARLKYLLGRPDTEVVDLFKEAMGSLESLEESYQLDTHLKYARFLEKSSNPDKAKYHYENVIRLADIHGGKYKAAKHRLSYL